MKKEIETVRAAMKARTWVATLGVAGGLAGLLMFVGLAGCRGVPTKTEQRFFDIETNLLPRVVWVTNVGAAGEQGAGDLKAESRKQKAESEGPVLK